MSISCPLRNGIVQVRNRGRGEYPTLYTIAKHMELSYDAIRR